MNGPFPCGSTDLQIARSWLSYELEKGEKYLADGLHNGGKFSATPNGLSNNIQTMISLSCDIHETVNRRFKKFGILSQWFRLSLNRHGTVALAVANITQFAIRLDNPLFNIEYNDRVNI